MASIPPLAKAHAAWYYGCQVRNTAAIGALVCGRSAAWQEEVARTRSSELEGWNVNTRTD